MKRPGLGHCELSVICVSNMKELVTSHIWWVTLVLGLAMLLAHTFRLEAITIDTTAIILLVVVAISPFISAITKIKFGDLEAVIDPREVKLVTEKVKDQAAPTQGVKLPSRKSEDDDSLQALVESDPVLALAKLRIELEKQLKKLYRATFPDSRGGTPTSAARLLHLLRNSDIIDSDSAKSIREVIKICSRAVHGEEIRREDAESVVEAGSRLLTELACRTTELRMQPTETVEVDSSVVEELLDGTYHVITIVPYREGPIRNTYVLTQEGLYDFLEGYSEHAEFIVDVERIRPDDRPNKATTSDTA